MIDHDLTAIAPGLLVRKKNEFRGIALRFTAVRCYTYSQASATKYVLLVHKSDLPIGSLTTHYIVAW